MVGPESDMKVDLNDIVNISEDEFKRQISSWIDERGISRTLQSKLRADLFEHFNRTHLGRKMAEQHSLVHRIVLSPQILVLNTLVADFLYAEDCHFTLSVFANEVPFKNTLPNFEATPARTLFRFTESELKDIFEAIGISKQSEKTVRQFYSNAVENGSSELLNRSLLYCIFRTITSRTQTEPTNYDKKSKPLRIKSRRSTTPLASSTQQSVSSSASIEPYRKCTDCKRFWSKHDKFHVSSRYFKYVNQYLDIFSDRLNEVLKAIHEKPQKQNKISADATSQESSLKKDLRKMVDNINRLTKSKRKSKQFQDILNSIEKLSATVDKCSQHMENFIETAKMNSKLKNDDNLAGSSPSSNNRNDRLKDMDYATWLKELKTSNNGKKFIDRLETSIQKVMEKERTNMQKLYDEKTNNYRMLIRLHYKQKYDVENKNEKPVESQPVEVSSSDKISTDFSAKELADSLTAKAIEKEHHVDQIVQSAKARLQELEREGEQLDESFQLYLRRQKMMKRQMNDDVTHIWDSYNLGKAALEQYDSVSGQANLMHNQPKFMNATKLDRTSDFELNENDDDTILRDFEEIRQLKSPQFDKNDIFSKETVFASMKPKMNDTCHVVSSDFYTMAREKLQKEFDELSELALKAATPASISPKKWNPIKEKEIEAWKSKVNENNKNSNCLNLEETIDDFYRKRNETLTEHQIEKHCETLEDRSLITQGNAVNNIQPEIKTRIEQEDSRMKSQNKILTAEPKNLSAEIEPKETAYKSALNESKSSDSYSANIEKMEHIEPTVIITSKIGKLNLNESLTNPKNVFTKLSSVESDEDSSLPISIGPTQPSKSDNFW